LITACLGYSICLRAHRRATQTKRTVLATESQEPWDGPHELRHMFRCNRGRGALLLAGFGSLLTSGCDLDRTAWTHAKYDTAKGYRKSD
jgi:hypothetical protein